MGFLVLICQGSRAQRIGVDAGWFVSKYSFLYEVSPFGISKTDVTLSQDYLPSLSIRPFVQVYRNSCFYTGIDLLQHQINYHENPMLGYNYRNTIYHKELHIPVMYKFVAGGYQKKFSTSLYLGAFYRKVYETRITFRETGPSGDEVVRLNKLVASGTLNGRSETYLNYIFGIKENFRIKKWIQPYIDAHLKVFKGSYAARFLSPYADSNLSIKYKYSLNLSFGFSFMSVPRKKEPYNGNPLHMNE